jgi:hypothetical protein
MMAKPRGFAPIGMRRAHTVYYFAFSNLQETLVSTQQVSAASRKSFTLIQMLGLIGAAGLIAAILLNQLV